MTTTNARAEFEALLDNADVAVMEATTSIPLAVLQFIAYCEDNCAAIAAALTTDAPTLPATLATPEHERRLFRPDGDQ